MPRPRLRITPRRPPLNVGEILSWADEYFAQYGRWPNINSGPIPGTIDDTWRRMDDALRNGHRTLPRNSGLSLARLLGKRRGVRNTEYPPRLSIARIVSWAKAHRERTGRWPTERGGAIVGASGETWLAINMALRKGRRGLAGGSSLARLLASRCHARNRQYPPQLTIASILRLADKYYARHGRRPTGKSGPIPWAAGETWLAIDKALHVGRRGLPGGMTLSRLLDERRPKWKSARSTAALPSG